MASLQTLEKQFMAQLQHKSAETWNYPGDLPTSPIPALGQDLHAFMAHGSRPPTCGRVLHLLHHHEAAAREELGQSSGLQRAGKCSSCFHRLRWSICMQILRCFCSVCRPPWVVHLGHGLGGVPAGLEGAPRARAHRGAAANHHACSQLQHALPAAAAGLALSPDDITDTCSPPHTDALKSCAQLSRRLNYGGRREAAAEMVTLAEKKTASVQVCWRHSRQSICSPMAFRPRSWRPRPRLLSSSSRCSSRRRCRPRPLMAPRPCRPQVQRLRQHSHLPQLPLDQKSLECAHPAPQLASDEFPGAQNSTVRSQIHEQSSRASLGCSTSGAPQSLLGQECQISILV